MSYDDYNIKGQQKLKAFELREQIYDVDIYQIKRPSGRKHVHYHRRKPHKDNEPHKVVNPVQLDPVYLNKVIVTKDTRTFNISEERFESFLEQYMNERKNFKLFNFLTEKELFYLSLCSKKIWGLMDSKYWMERLKSVIAGMKLNFDNIFPHIPYSPISKLGFLKANVKNAKSIFLNRQPTSPDPILDSTYDISIVQSESGLHQINKTLFRPEKLGFLQGLSVGNDEVYLWQYAWTGSQAGIAQVHGTYQPEGDIEKVYFLGGNYFVIESFVSYGSKKVKHQISLFKTVTLDIFDPETDLEKLRDDYYPLIVAEYISKSYEKNDEEDDNEDIIKIECEAVDEDEFKVTLKDEKLFIFKSTENALDIFSNKGRARVLLPKEIDDIFYTYKDNLILAVASDGKEFHTFNLPEIDLGEYKEYTIKETKFFTKKHVANPLVKTNWYLHHVEINGEEKEYLVILEENRRKINLLSLTDENNFGFESEKEIFCFAIFGGCLVTFSDDDLVRVIKFTGNQEIFSYSPKLTDIKGFAKHSKQILCSENYIVLILLSDFDELKVYYINWSLIDLCGVTYANEKLRLKGEFVLQGSNPREEVSISNWEIKFVYDKLLIYQNPNSMIVDFLEGRSQFYAQNIPLNLQNVWGVKPFEIKTQESEKKEQQNKNEKKKKKFVNINYAYLKNYSEINHSKLDETEFKRISEKSEAEKASYTAELSTWKKSKIQKKLEREQDKAIAKEIKALKRKTGHVSKVTVNKSEIEQYKKDKGLDQEEENSSSSKSSDEETKEEEYPEGYFEPPKDLHGSEKVKQLLKDYNHDKSLYKYRYNYFGNKTVKQELIERSKDFQEKIKKERRNVNREKRNQYDP